MLVLRRLAYSMRCAEFVSPVPGTRLIAGQKIRQKSASGVKEVQWVYRGRDVVVEGLSGFRSEWSSPR